MTASDLTEWVGLFLMDLQPDGAGGYVEQIPPALTSDIPANVREVSGSETRASDQLASRVRYEITIRYEPGYTSSHRVLWRDQYLDIVAPPENVGARDTWLKLQCMRREAGTQ